MFSWRRLILTLQLIWKNVIVQHNFNEMDFQLSYDGRVIPQGFISTSLLL